MGVDKVHSEIGEWRIDCLMWIPALSKQVYNTIFQWEVVFTLLAPHLEGVLIVRGPKLPNTGGRSTEDPLVIAPDCSILVTVYTQLGHGSN